MGYGNSKSPVEHVAQRDTVAHFRFGTQQTNRAGVGSQGLNGLADLPFDSSIKLPIASAIGRHNLDFQQSASDPSCDERAA
jgi:hypothetical protein